MITRTLLIGLLSVAAHAAALENARLRVTLDASFPRVLRYELKSTGAVFGGGEPGSADTVEINGAPFTELKLDQAAPMRGERKYRVSATFDKDEARYTFRAFETYGVLAFDIVFRLEGDALVMRLERVAERGGYRLDTLYFPHHELVSAKAGSVFRVEFRRTDDGRGLIRWDRVYNGPLAGLKDKEVQPTHWAMLSEGRAVAFIENNIPVFPVDTFASGKSAALWSGPYHYRLNGRVMEPFAARVRFAGDENGDGKIDWVDGAMCLRETMAAPGPEYENAFLYKIFCARPAEPVSTTFAQSLEIVRKLYHLTNHRPQIVYLVGWQHSGHDSRWPDMSVINPNLGGKQGLLSLMEEARAYNATISFHMNIDDVYKSSPAWDDRVICRKPDGALMDWQVFNGEMAYHASHAKDAQYGKVFTRIDNLLRMVPLEKTVHIDAMRYSNESWDADRFIDLTAEFEGWSRIAGTFREHGISITTEGAAAGPAYVGRVAGFWHLLGGKLEGKEQFWFLAHRRWAGGGTKSAERVAFGNSRDRDVTAETSLKEIVEGYYLDTLLQQYFDHFEATNYIDDGNALTITYGKNCTASYDRKHAALLVKDRGIPIAMGTDRFVPVENGILAYSKAGGKQKWLLPAEWRGEQPVLWALTESGRKPGPQCRVEAGSLLFEAAAGQPYLITK